MSNGEHPFDNDVFISYAHLDNQQLGDGREGWVSAFHHDLNVLLGQQLGRGVTLWRDAELKGNTAYGEALDTQVPRSAAIVSIVSSRYIESAWCQREVEGFVALADRGIGSKVDMLGRVFPVVVNSIDEQKLPPVLRRFLGYRFFRSDPASGRVRRLDRRFGREYEEAYYAVLNDLAEDLAVLVRRVQTPTEVLPPAGQTATVYLSLTSEDLWPVRETIARELRGRGHTLLPDAPMPAAGSVGFDRHIEGQLRRADLAIHLVGARAAQDPSLGMDVVEAQARVAAAMAITAPLSNLFWVEPSIELGEPRGPAAGFLCWLRDEAARGRRVDLLQTHLEELKAVAGEWLEGARRLLPAAAGGAGIWLAEPTTDLHPDRDALLQHLGNHGLRTTAANDIRYTPDYLSSVGATVGDADVAVHLLGDRYGVIPEGLEQSIQELQHEAASGRPDGFKQVVWWRGKTPSDPRQGAFLEVLRREVSALDDVHLFEDEDAAAVAHRIVELVTPDEPEEEEAEAEGTEEEAEEPAVYVVFDEVDLDAVEPLLDALYEGGFDDLKPLMDGTPEEVREQHEENLRDAAGLILFHGQAGERWLNVQARELKRAPAVRGGKPLPVLVVLGPPDERHKTRYRSRGAEVVHAEAGLALEALEPFLVGLKPS